MASYGKTVLTSAGLTLAKENLNGSTQIHFTRVVTSADTSLINATISKIEGMTSLASVVQSGTVSAFDTSNPKQVGLKCSFTNAELATGYRICAIGVYAKPANGNEILYAVTPAADPETMPAKPTAQSALFSFSLMIYALVGQSGSVAVEATTEGTVKSINGWIKPDTNGNVTIDTSTQANALQAQLISGRLYVPVSDESGNPLRDEAGNALTAVEYLPKTVSVDGEAPINPDVNNNINLPVFSKGETLRMLDGKLDEIFGRNSIEELYGISLSSHAWLIGNQVVVPLCDDEGNPLRDEAGNIIVDDVHFVMSVNGQTPGPDGAITLPDTYTKREIEQRLGVKSNYLESEAEHANLQKQLDDHEKHLASNDCKICDTVARSKLTEATIAAGCRLIPISDEAGNVLTDESGNAIAAQERELRTVQGKEPDSSGNVNLDVYSKQEINNKLDGLKEQIAFLMSKINKE